MPRAEHAPAGFWPRAVAWLVDAAILGGIACLLASSWMRGDVDALGMAWRGLGSTLGEAVRSSVERGEDATTFMAAMLAADSPLRLAIAGVIAAMRAVAAPPLIAFIVLGLLYWPRLEAGARGATIGKRLLGLRSASGNGERLSSMRAFKRHLAGTLSWLTLNVGHLLAAGRPAHRALHDRIAGTQVLWCEDASRRVPWWGQVLLIVAVLVPLLLAVAAAMSLATAMQAALDL